MDKENHGVCMGNSLRQKGFYQKAIDWVTQADWMSDAYVPPNQFKNWQHFLHFKSSFAATLNASLSFIRQLKVFAAGCLTTHSAASPKQSNLDWFKNLLSKSPYHQSKILNFSIGGFSIAKLIGRDMTDNPLDDTAMGLGLYILGRLSHCIQDFYAHTNYLMLCLHHRTGLKRWNELANCFPTLKSAVFNYGKLGAEAVVKYGFNKDGVANAFVSLKAATELTTSGAVMDDLYNRIIGQGTVCHYEMALDNGTYPAALLISRKFGLNGIAEMQNVARDHTIKLLDDLEKECYAWSDKARTARLFDAMKRWAPNPKVTMEEIDSICRSCVESRIAGVY